MRFFPSLLIACVLLMVLGGDLRAQQTDCLYEIDPCSKAKPSNLSSEVSKSAARSEASRQEYPSTSQPALQPREKLEYGLKKAFLSPEAYVRPGISAYLRERNTVKAPGKGSGDQFADGLSSFARAFANRSTAQLFGSGIYPILFKQDPRYRPSNREGVWARTVYAASRAVLTQGDNGKPQINYSKLAGNMTSAALANLYERDRVTARDSQERVLEVDRQIGTGPTFKRFGVLMLTGVAGRIVFDEFDLDGKAGKALLGLFGKD